MRGVVGKPRIFSRSLKIVSWPLNMIAYLLQRVLIWGTRLRSHTKGPCNYPNRIFPGLRVRA